MDTSTHSALQGCVSSLRSSMHLLDSSIQILNAGVHDFPRLSRVLTTTRHFELVSEHDLTTAQASLLGEIQPEVANLLARVEAHLDRLARRERSLIAKAELQAGRLSSRPSHGASSMAAAATHPPKSPRALGAAEMMKAERLRQKKDRLSYAVSRLELQAGQRERQLRKSMAAQ